MSRPYAELGTVYQGLRFPQFLNMEKLPLLEVVILFEVNLAAKSFSLRQ